MGGTITIRSALIGVSVLILCFTEYVALFQGKFQLALVALAMNAVNIAWIHLAFKTRNDYLKIFGFATLLHELHRIPFFADPSFAGIYNPIIAVWGFPTESEVIYSLLVILGFQVVGGAAIFVCGQMFRLHLHLDRTSEIDRDFSPLFVWYLILQMVFLYDYLILGVGRRGIESESLGWIGLVLNSEVALVLLAFVIFINWKRYDHAWYRLLATSYFAITVVIFTVWGSRRGIYQFVVIGLITMMTVWPNRKWRVGPKKLVFASVLVLSMVATYALGTEYRRVVLHQGREPGVRAVMSVDISDTLITLWNRREVVFQHIWYRMSQLDDVTMAILMEDSRFAHEVNVVNNIKVLANHLVIGDVFPGVLVSGKAWMVDYYGNSVAEAWGHPTTYVPGAFGYSVATFGVIGGMAGLSILIWVFIVGAKLGSVWVPLEFQKYYTFAVYYLFFGQVIAGMGLDQLGFSCFLWIIQTGLIVLFVTSYKVVRRVVRPEKIEPLAYLR